MGQLAVAGGGAVVGAVIGTFAGNPFLGAQIGFTLGSVAGAALFPEKGPTTEGPRLSDLAIQTSGYGVPLPALAGNVKVAGNMIWATPIEERKTVRRQGGKGGGGAKSVTYSYYQSWAIGLGEWLLPPSSAQVLRIWLDTILVYDATGTSDVTQIPYLVWRFHDGNEAQLPDPLIIADKGEEHAPAHRGLAYIVFEVVPLDRFGNRTPNVTVELVADATRSFTQVAAVDPVSPIYTSTPSHRTYISSWPTNVAVDHARGRIYEARSRTTGATGIGNDELIRVYDLTSMQTIGEYPMGDMVRHLFPLGSSPTTNSVSAGLMHLGVDGYLYCTGGDYNRVPLWKIDPDTWHAVGVFGNPAGDGFGFGDNGTYLINPMQITSLTVPRLGADPLTLVVVQGSYSTALTINADTMSYVWGAGDVALAPPVMPIGLGIGPLSYPVQLVRGMTRDDGAVELWCLRGSELGTPFRIDVVKYRYYGIAAPLSMATASGIERDDFTAIDVQAEVDALNVRPLLHAAWWDQSDGTLVMTISGTGSPLSGYGRFTTFKWNPGGGVIWKIVDHALSPYSDGRGNMGRVLGPTWGLGGNLLIQHGTGAALINQLGDEFNNLYWLDERQAVLGYTVDGAGAYPIAKRYLDRLAPNALTVGAVVEALAGRAGLDATRLDVSALTDGLRGYVLARPMSARDAISQLASAFQFQAAEQDDVLVFPKRGGAPVATIAYDDLVREGPEAGVLDEQRLQDADLPREVAVRFLDIERGWEQNSQPWRRPVSPTATVGATASITIDLAIPLTVDEGKTIAKRICLAAWQERTKLSGAVAQKFLRLVPTDVVNIQTRDGATIRCNIRTANLGANWVTRLEALTEDAAVYGLTATGDGGGGWLAPTLPLPYAVRLILPNMTLVDDGDDTGQGGLREYALMGAYDPAAFRATLVYRSPDANDWSELGVVTQPVTWGNLVATPAVPVTPWTWDDLSTIEIRLNDGEVDSATALEVLNGANLAAIISTDGNAELVQFRDAAALGEGRYSLSGLLRGRRGTEDLIASRAAGDLFVLLSEDLLRFQSGTSESAAVRYHRPVTIYDTVQTAATTLVKSRRGRAEQPYAPCQVVGARDGSSNLSLTWVRRARYGGEWLDGAGTVPLGEATEAYEVDVLNGPPAASRIYSATAGSGAASAFDGSSATYWLTSSALPQRLTVQFGAAQVVRQYSITAGPSVGSTARPESWTFEGSNDGSTWDVLDTQTSVPAWSNLENRDYTLAAAATYLFYRLNVSAKFGAVNLQVGELALRRQAGSVNFASSAYVQTVVRTITGLTAPAASYSAANQTTDFGAAQPELFLRIYQLSNIVGRGIAAEVTV